MINARRGLVSMVRGFFDTQVGDLLHYNSAYWYAGEPAPREGNRRNPEGPHRALVRVGFGKCVSPPPSPDGEPTYEFEMEVASPGDQPPLGMIRLYHHQNLIEQGPLDSATWARAGRAIREQYRGKAA